MTGAAVVPGGASDSLGALSPSDLVSKYEGQGKILRLLHLKSVPVGKSACNMRACMRSC